LPGHQYFGPGTDVLARLAHGHSPIDRDDQIALRHDLDYLKATTMDDLQRADNAMSNSLGWTTPHAVIGQLGMAFRKIGGFVEEYLPNPITSGFDMRGNSPLAAEEARIIAYRNKIKY
jgi:hypothetical protein